MDDPFVLLCPCWDLAEAQAIRASLAARGVAVMLDGEHQRGVLGMMGAAISLRVMVRRSQLELARQLAAELIPDLAAPESLDPDEALMAERHSPARRAPLELDDEDADDADTDDPDEPELPRKKSIAVALVVSALGFAVGTLHMYAGKEKAGLVLFFVAAFGFGGYLSGQPWGALLVMVVWAIDITRGLVLLRRHNAAIDALANQRRLARMN